MDVQMIKVVQEFDKSYIEDVKSRVESELDRLKPGGMKGKRISITAGSRGIDRIADILKTVVGKVREYGGEPFLVPAMGSHGGATAEGQVKILEEWVLHRNTLMRPYFHQWSREIGKCRYSPLRAGNP